jgi:hypothetical protein
MWLGLTQPTGSWVGQTDTVQFPLALTSLSLSPLLRPWSPPPPPEDFGHLRWFPLPSFEANDRLHADYLSSNWIQNPAPVRGDPLPGVIRVSATRPSLSLTTAALARSCVLSCCDAAGGRAGAGRSSRGGVAPPCRRCCHQWSLPQVAPGWPCEHCLAMPAR